jgi:dolichyl-diphosphooligosaccharide--protein glycosyltransferase/undecaprenyl-diphosphooligosaccharide--protein glycosyltransferase
MSNQRLSLDTISTKQMIGLMALAYAFSFLIRMIWVWQFQDMDSFYWNDQLMINTNDGYFFASGVQQALEGLHTNNPRVFGMFDYGVIFFTTLLVKLTPMSLESAILYAPTIFSSLVVIPIILIGRLYNQTMWGFFAALLGSITWSYYNRTMTGYYDTDMFSAMAPMFILFFLIKSTLDLNLKSALWASIAIAIYPFLYDQGLSIVYAIGIIYALYMLFHHHKEDITYFSLILIFVSLLPFPFGSPLSYILKIAVLIGLYLFLKKGTLEHKQLIILTAVTFFAFLIFGNVFGLIYGKIMSYVSTGTKAEGLHFYSVAQTVREAGKIPFETFANRTSGSIVGVIIALVGYIALVVRHRAFILALPLIGIGVFSLWGGLRFTVYAVPIAGMSAIFLFWVIAEKFINDNRAKLVFVAILTIGMIYPNIVHILAYKVPTVFNKAEVKDLVQLNKIASDKDYTFAWWDYGYPIWFYSDTSTLIDGGKHNNDNFIISKIMFSTSPQQVANLSRLAVETYVDSNYSVVANTIFNTKENPEKLLKALTKPDFKLPKKTREVYLYMPMRMLRIFPTVGVFGNLDLKTGRKKRNIQFYESRVIRQVGSKVMFANGMVADINRGTIELGKIRQNLYKFDIVEFKNNGEIALHSEYKHYNGAYSLIFMKSYGSVLVVDRETYNSAYIQMFVLGKYDKNLFELVVSSPYSKIYRVKR